MSFDTTILTEKISGIKKAFENGRYADALIGALNTGNGLMQQRIFTTNKDVEGNGFGQYIGVKRRLSKRGKLELLAGTTSKTDLKRIKTAAGQALTPYQRKRANKGRQTDKKDLEFTGGVRRAIETVVENEKAAALSFNNDKAAAIAQGQEIQIANIRAGRKGTTKGEGIKIFRLNISEKQQVDEQGLELIKQILKPS